MFVLHPLGITPALLGSLRTTGETSVGVVAMQIPGSLQEASRQRQPHRGSFPQQCCRGCHHLGSCGRHDAEDGRGRGGHQVPHRLPGLAQAASWPAPSSAGRPLLHSQHHFHSLAFQIPCWCCMQCLPNPAQIGLLKFCFLRNPARSTLARRGLRVRHVTTRNKLGYPCIPYTLVCMLYTPATHVCNATLQRLTVIWHQAVPPSGVVHFETSTTPCRVQQCLPGEWLSAGVLRASLELLSGGVQVKRTQLYLTTLQMQIHIYKGELAGAKQQLNTCMGLTHTGAEYRPGFIRCPSHYQQCMPCLTVEHQNQLSLLHSYKCATLSFATASLIKL